MELIYLFIGLLLGAVLGGSIRRNAAYLTAQQQARRFLKDTFGGMTNGESAHVIVVLGKGKGKGGDGISGIVDEEFFESWRDN